RYSNEKDILVGTALAGRTHQDVESLIGFFVNSLVIRTDLSGKPTFSELLKQNSRNILDAYAHQDLPFQTLVEKISPARNLNYNPIFQIAFTLENTQHDITLEKNSNVEIKERPFVKARFDLEIHIYEENQGDLSLDWVVDSSLFNSNTIDRLMANYETLLSNIVAVMKHSADNHGARTEPSVHEIPLLADSEIQVLLHEWNGPQEQSQLGLCFHELFEKQVSFNPEKTALVSDDSILSYQALNEKANQVAHYLLEQGIKSEALIALCIPRSLQAIVALLGILKAGGAYVPLDSSYPKARLQYMLEHSKVEFILTETHLLEKLPLDQQKVICLDSDEIQAHLQSYPTENITECPVKLTENNLAYVIYTSGSTGKPKGVMLEHKGWVNLAISQAALFGVNTNSRGLQFASWSFDAFAFELSMILTQGASLYLMSEEQYHTPALLDEVVEKHQITHATLPPVLLSHLKLEKWKSVSTMVVAGEAITLQLAALWSQGRQLFNGYGPTETTVCVTAGRLFGDQINIGKPLHNTVIRILDADGHLAPIGAVGELCVGGIQLARGYLHAPEITARQFIADPFSEKVTDRLYRTGDLARFSPDGNVEFIGRIDSQVKIRGYRIETGEIETALMAHEALNHAVVVTDSHDNENKKLIAYVSPSSSWLVKKATEFNAGSLERWTSVFEEQYIQNASQTIPEDNLENDFRGWNNSYTGQPIAIEQMEEWRTGTIQLINTLQPRRLLEIGCGTGLLLYRYAAHCETVLATDISAAALAAHQKELNCRGWHHVQLRQGDALNLELLEDDNFDCVIINSVVQYFPNLQYLETLFDQLLPHIVAGGKILLGDIRNLDLLPTHAAAMEHNRLSEQGILAGELANHLQRRLQQEQELLISPTYFAHLPQHYLDISRVDLRVKRGVGDNEMLRYRYDVILQKKGSNQENSPNANFTWFDFSTLEHIHSQLQTGMLETFGISGIPNARINEDLALSEGLRYWPANQKIMPPAHIGHLSIHAIEQIQALESLLQYAEQCGYQCGVTWSQKQLDLLDVIFSRGELPPVQARADYSKTYLANYPQISSIGNELSELLKSRLEKQLPEFMVPNLYIPLERMPLTLNNKVDKRALPIPDENDLRKQNYIAPRNKVEEKLCELWQKHLKIRKIGIYDNFFSLGGHSLLAVKITSAIKSELADNFIMNQLFTAPTIAEIANVIQNTKKHELPTIEETRKILGGKIPISYWQKIFWSFIEEGILEDCFHAPILLLMDGELNLNALEKSLNTIMERHESLRLNFYKEDEQVFIKLDNERKIDCKIINSLPEIKEKEQIIIAINELWEKELRASFDVYHDSLIRAFLLPISERKNALLIDFHHIISDGWSMNILETEIKQLYEIYSQGQEIILPPVTMQYSDCSYDQYRHHTTELYQRQIQFWQKQFDDIKMDKDFPIPFNKHTASNYRFKVHHINTPDLLNKAASKYCETNNITPYMLFMSLFHACLFMYSGESQQIATSPQADRASMENQQTIGMFLNALIVKSTINQEMSLYDIIRQISEFIYKAQENLDIHISSVADFVGKKVRDNIFNVIFNYMDAQSFLENKNEVDGDELSQYNLDIELIDLEPIPFQSLGINLKNTSKNIICELSYNPELYTEETANALVRYYERLLEAIVSGQDKENISYFYD
ncbi:non-ribosomal peptide synthetase, partial [Xenorhabdus nematophila]|uniref:non-ribosomal peptide synthetase n=1 Tax=Xenorhabdus nematophila TaxID=628 RepID=UPI00056DB41A